MEEGNHVRAVVAVAMTIGPKMSQPSGPLTITAPMAITVAIPTATAPPMAALMARVRMTGAMGFSPNLISGLVIGVR